MEQISYEALGLCGEGEGGAMVDAGDNTYGGRVVVNPSGGLISKGHPLGATGQFRIFLLLYLRRSRQIRERKALFFLLFFSLFLGWTIFHFPMYSFWGCEKAKNFVSKGM